jgi:glycosyltransferase involved in cell wall biosynthesis
MCIIIQLIVVLSKQIFIFNAYCKKVVEKERRHKIAYVSRLIYPDRAANAIQTIRMASEFARQTGDAHLFVRDMVCSVDQIRQQFGVDELPHIWSLHVRRWPSIVYRSGWARFVTYNSIIAAIFGISSKWRPLPDRRNVLFVRSGAEFLYWGLMRPYLRWLCKWVCIYEVHDIKLPSHLEEFAINSRAVRRTAKALKNYDLVLTVSEGLAEDIRTLTHGHLDPKVIPCATGLSRLSAPPLVTLSSERIILGYIGTIDREHGIEDLFQVMKLLPENFVLRIIGRVRSHDRIWIDTLMEKPSLLKKVELKPPVDYSAIMAEIDACNILLLPAGDAIHSRKYRSPLKLFDYMARGKPIVAAGVPCNLELLHHERNAFIYQPGNPHEMVALILKIVKNTQLLETVARTAWKQSVNYTYDARVRRILDLVDEVKNHRKKK